MVRRVAMLALAWLTLGSACEGRNSGNDSPTFGVSGAISGAITGGVSVRLGDAGNATIATTTTEGDGRFSFAGVAEGTYNVTPSRTGYTFDPVSRTVLLGGASVAGQDFSAMAFVPSPHVVSGTLSGAVFAEVIVMMKGAGLATTVVIKTDAGGRYSFVGVADGTYTVKPRALGYAFTPESASITVAGADVSGCDFGSTPTIWPTLYGWIEGATLDGVQIELTGAVTRTTTTDVFGGFILDPVPAGTYTVTATSPSWSFVPSHYDVTWNNLDLGGLGFLSTPPSSSFSVQVAGDGASGVAGGTFPGNNGNAPNADVAVYDPANDVWTIGMRFDPPPYTGMGGFVSYRGTPAAGTYTESTSGLWNTYGLCWSAASEPGGNSDQHWVATTFALTLTDVGAGVPTNVHGASSLSYVSYYPIHGTFHAVCTPASNSSAQGTVTLDIPF